MNTNSEVSIRRVTLLKLLNHEGPLKVEAALVSLMKYAFRASKANGNKTVVLMTDSVVITFGDMKEIFAGEQKDRVTAKGVKLLNALYRDGYFSQAINYKKGKISFIGQPVEYLFTNKSKTVSNA